MSRRASSKQPPVPSAEQLRAATTPPVPGQTPYGVLSFAHFFFRRMSGVIVNEETALQYGAVFACVRVIAEDIAGLPWHVLRRRQDGGKDEIFDHPVDWLLDVQANPETPAFQFRETLLAHALTWGNGYAEIERDALGRPVWLWQITPDRVTPMRDEQGNVVYEVSNYDRSATYLPAQDVFHLRGLGFDGLVGYSVIRMAARAIGIGISQEENAGEFFANDSTPGGVLKHPGTLSEKAKNSLMTSWERRHKGPENVRRVAVLEEGMAYEQVGLPPGDAQLIESRQFQPEEIARWFRVAPHKIQHLLRSTNNNIEHQSLEHVNDTLMPWVRRLELEADIKLFGPINRVTRLITKMSVDSRLRGDSTARVNYITKLLSWGVLNINEAREIEGYNPVTDGDTHFVAVNMQRLEDAAAEPEPSPVPQLSPPAEGNGNGDGGEKEETAGPDEKELRAYFRPLFLDAFTRVVHRVKHRATEYQRDCTSKGKESWADRLSRLWPDIEAYGVKMLESPCRTFGSVLGKEVVCPKAFDGLKSYALTENPDWDGWASAETDLFLNEATT